jgi:23S rRNA (guanosine2251-2'-O)-methyltransferase
MMPVIFGVNPVKEALEAAEKIEKVYILKGKGGPVIGQIYSLARQMNIQVVHASRTKLDAMSQRKKHQGVVALLAAIDYATLDQLVENVQKKGDTPNFIILDKLNDPQNFGAIIRSAEILGIQGIIFSSRDSVPVTDLVVKASAGAIFHLEICKVNNLARAIDYLQDCGIWIYASSLRAEKLLWDMDFSQPQAIIVGSEGKGVRPLLVKKSDEIFRIPQSGRTASLNASVAAGIIMVEIFKQRQWRSRPKSN